MRSFGQCDFEHDSVLMRCWCNERFFSLSLFAFRFISSVHFVHLRGADAGAGRHIAAEDTSGTHLMLKCVAIAKIVAIDKITRYSCVANCK